MNFLKRILLPAAVSLLGASQAFAQSETEFVKAFSGEWYVFDSSFRSNGQTCSITLSQEKNAQALEASTEGCTEPLGAIETWKIVDGRILLSKEDELIAAMGGNQFRVTGELANTDRTAVMERAAGDGNSKKIAAALSKHKCYFVGFTQVCAETEMLRLPDIDDEVGHVTVETLVNLNARALPRRDAAIVGNVATGTEVKLNQCLTASDGNWCRARVGDTSIWLAMTALRMEEWPIVTFRVVQMP